MPAQIGDFQFTTFQGFMLPATQRVAQVEADVGTDGNGVVFGGWAADPIDVTTQIDVPNAPAALSQSFQYSALIGQTVTVTDQFGITWPYTTVMGVRTVYAQTLTGYRLSATWRLMPQTERPPGVEANRAL